MYNFHTIITRTVLSGVKRFGINFALPLQQFGLPEGKMSKDLPPMLFSELSPVAAIVGGILAQEIIKVISNKDEPHKNFFLYNPLESAGIVEDVGAAA